MDRKQVDRLVAGAVLLYALVLYLLTMSPTVSFWDPGERIAVSHGLQIPHPPGAPFYMLIGRVFSMFMPSSLVAPAINLVSVLSSALSVLLAHLIIVRMVRLWQPPGASRTFFHHFTALAAGVIGACTFAATDSFWYNAGIAETYAISLFFTAVVIWLILKWSELAKREDPGTSGSQHLIGLKANRYLVLIAYLFGLAIGIHLLNLLAIFFIGLIVFFTEFDRDEWSPKERWIGIFAAAAATSVVFLFIYPGLIQVMPDLISRSGSPFFALILLIGSLLFGLYYAHRYSMQAASLVLLCVVMIFIGYSSYTLIPIRSAVDPPIDQNNPESFDEMLSYLMREQYGATPLMRGSSYDNQLGRVDDQQEKLFPRRHSPLPQHWQVYDRYNSDWDFFWNYQVGHMYVRYFLWNFMGRASDTQDAPAITGFRFIDDSIEGSPPFLQTPSERAPRNAYFMLPLLLGLFGMVFHFQKDWRRAFSLLAFFLISGIGIIVYLNQTPMQPRERDYSYVGSFLAFSLWTGIGAAGMLELVRYSLEKDFKPALQKAALYGMSALLFAAVPLLMMLENYDDHDRSGRYIAKDYAYNMLSSVDEEAILFTNGDNDTFPLWYLQEVEGVRRDVRVVNLSLLQTAWYTRQLKHNWARESPPLPITLSDDQIEDLSPRQWQPSDVELAIDQERAADNLQIPEDDRDQVVSRMQWRLEGQQFGENIWGLRGNDQVVYNMLQNIADDGWQRPIYFAVTTGQESQLGLQDFFQTEGLAQRVVPIRTETRLGRVVPGISDERLRHFRFTNLDDPDVYYDETIRNMVNYYRTWYSHTAQSLGQEGHTEKGRELINTILEQVPFATIQGTMQSFMMVSQALETLGDEQRAVAVLQQSEPLVLHELTHAETTRDQQMAAQYYRMLEFAYMDAGDFEAASALSAQVAQLINDPTFERSPDELRDQFDVEEDMLPDASPPQGAPAEPPTEQP